MLLSHNTPVSLLRMAGQSVEETTVGAILREMCERDSFVVNSLGGGYAIAHWNDDGRNGDTYLFTRRVLGRRYVCSSVGTCLAHMDA